MVSFVAMPKRTRSGSQNEGWNANRHGCRCWSEMLRSFLGSAVVSTLTSDGDAESYIRQEAQNFFNALGLEELDQHTPGLDALIGQMSVRARLRDERGKLSSLTR